MNLLALIPSPTWRDLIDIIFLTLVIYQLYVWFRGTRALRVLIGLLVLGGVYSMAKLWGLFLTTKVFQILWQVLLILLLILFQSEIRQVLEKVSPLRYLRLRRRAPRRSLARDLVAVCFDLARERTGALIVLVREDNPAEFLHAGQKIMALPEPALIKSIFNRHSPSHDGALILSQGRFTHMGCILPLSEREDIPEYYGTRHRAALGLSEHTDCVCLVVSEERSEVSTVVRGRIDIWNDQELLASRIEGWLSMPEVYTPSLQGFLQGIFLKNWGSKLGAFGLVTMAWLVLAGQQTIQINVTSPVGYVDYPPGMVLVEKSADTVKLALSGMRRSVEALKGREVPVKVELGNFKAGTHRIRLSGKNVDLPLGIMIDRVTPEDIKIVLKPARRQ